MYKPLFLSACFLVMCITVQGARTVTSEEAKLVGDGITMNTFALQKAIDCLSAKGGGTLILLPGRYVTGAFYMKSNVELHLPKGATLLGSTNPKDYKFTTKEREVSGLTDPDLVHALINADNAYNIKLSGEGMIDGRGREVAINIDSLHYCGACPLANYDSTEQRPREMYRPALLGFNSCKEVKISGLHFVNSACWGLVFNACEDMRLFRLDILNRAFWNNDGIDLVDCQRVEISHCHINSADDGFCLKSGDPNNVNRDIDIHDCSVKTSASAIKFGTASYGGFVNIHFARIKISDTFRSAIAIESVDGGRIENVLMEDIDAFNTGNPIFIRLGKRSEEMGTVSGITVRRMYCEMAFERPDAGYDMRGPIINTMINPIPSSITGLPGHPVKNIIIEDIMLVYPGNASKGMHYIPTWNVDRVPEQPDRYPEFDMFGELPSYAFFVRHADNIIFRNVNIKLKHDDFRPAFVLDDAHNVKFEQITYPWEKNQGQIFDTASISYQ